MAVPRKEKEIQEALGLYDPLDFLIRGTISVEFAEDTPESVTENYNIPVNDTGYISLCELQYPIKDAEDFLRKLLEARKKK